MGIFKSLLKRGMGITMDGYVYDGKYNFTGAKMIASKNPAIWKDSDYDAIAFYKLSDSLQDSTTGYGLATDECAREQLSNIKSYEKENLDNNYLLIKIVYKDDSSTTIKLKKNTTDTNRFEKVIYININK